MIYPIYRETENRETGNRPHLQRADKEALARASCLEPLEKEALEVTALR